MSETQPPVACYESPYLLDTPEKVKWANEHVEVGVFEPNGRKWRLYDSCHHRPAAMETVK